MTSTLRRPVGASKPAARSALVEVAARWAAPAGRGDGGCHAGQHHAGDEQPDRARSRRIASPPTPTSIQTVRLIAIDGGPDRPQDLQREREAGEPDRHRASGCRRGAATGAGRGRSGRRAAHGAGRSAKSRSRSRVGHRGVGLGEPVVVLGEVQPALVVGGAEPVGGGLPFAVGHPQLALLAHPATPPARARAATGPDRRTQARRSGTTRAETDACRQAPSLVCDSGHRIAASVTPAPSVGEPWEDRSPRPGRQVTWRALPTSSWATSSRPGGGLHRDHLHPGAELRAGAQPRPRRLPAGAHQLRRPGARRRRSGWASATPRARSPAASSCSPTSTRAGRRCSPTSAWSWTRPRCCTSRSSGPASSTSRSSRRRRCSARAAASSRCSPRSSGWPPRCRWRWRCSPRTSCRTTRRSPRWSARRPTSCEPSAPAAARSSGYAAGPGAGRRDRRRDRRRAAAPRHPLQRAAGELVRPRPAGAHARRRPHLAGRHPAGHRRRPGRRPGAGRHPAAAVAGRRATPSSATGARSAAPRAPPPPTPSPLVNLVDLGLIGLVETTLLTGSGEPGADLHRPAYTALADRRARPDPRRHRRPPRPQGRHLPAAGPRPGRGRRPAGRRVPAGAHSAPATARADGARAGAAGPRRRRGCSSGRTRCSTSACATG